MKSLGRSRKKLYKREREKKGNLKREGGKKDRRKYNIQISCMFNSLY